MTETATATERAKMGDIGREEEKREYMPLGEPTDVPVPEIVPENPVPATPAAPEKVPA